MKSRGLPFFLIALVQVVFLVSVLKQTHDTTMSTGVFTLYDIPVQEQTKTVRELTRASAGMKKATVSYAVRDFYALFGWVHGFNAKDKQGYYVPESLIEGYAGFLAPGRFAFVDTTKVPDFIIANPTSNDSTKLLTTATGDFSYGKLYGGRYLDLWKKADTGRQ